MATTTLSISVATSDIITKIKRNLAIIGKRAKNTSGQALFTDLTTSTAEDPIFDDLLAIGAENLAAELSDVATTYIENSQTVTKTTTAKSSVTSSVTDAEGKTTTTTTNGEETTSTSEEQCKKISFNIVSTRWNVSTTTEAKTVTDGDTVEVVSVTEPDLVNALKGLITNYLYNFCLARYLSAIHPQLGEKYPPLFGQTYLDACAVIITDIKILAFLKRPKDAPTDTSGKPITYGLVGVTTATNTSGS